MGYVYFTGKKYFVTCKILSGTKYFDTDIKKQIIKRKIAQAQKKFNIKIFAYVILSNHYHILLRSTHWKNVPKFLQLINGGSAYELNRLENIDRRSIWGDRWAKPVNTEKAFIKILGYILGNPYKHALVKNLLELYKYPFSSYQGHVKKYGLQFIDNIILHTIKLKLDLESEEEYLRIVEDLDE